MSTVDDTHVLLKYFYRLLGIVQFTTNETPSKISSFLAHICPIPTFIYFFYGSIAYILENNTSRTVYYYIEQIGGYASLFTMLTSAIFFFKRSEELKSCLLKLDSIQIYFITNKPPRKKKWICGVMLAILTVNMLLFHMVDGDFKEFVFYFVPPIVNAFDHVFLNDIFASVSCKFDLINQYLQRQENSVDLFLIFPLNKVEEVKSLKYNEIGSRIQRIQDLTQMHYRLVNLTIHISSLFEITTITSMMMWFGYGIQTVYYLVGLMMRETTKEVVVAFMVSFFYLMLYFYWLFLMVFTFSHTQKKANETATYVHDVWNKYALNDEVDKRVRHLQFVSLRLLNTRIQFTAKDFFNLDWTFCHMMIAAITTYLVILLQFNTP